MMDVVAGDLLFLVAIGPGRAPLRRAPPVRAHAQRQPGCGPSSVADARLSLAVSWLPEGHEAYHGEYRDHGNPRWSEWCSSSLVRPPTLDVDLHTQLDEAFDCLG